MGVGVGGCGGIQVDYTYQTSQCLIEFSILLACGVTEFSQQKACIRIKEPEQHNTYTGTVHILTPRATVLMPLGLILP